MGFTNGNEIAYADHSAKDLCCERGDDRTFDLFQLMQRGLVYPAPFATFATFRAKSGAKLTRDFVREIYVETRNKIHADFGSRNTTAIFGVSFDLFLQWCDEHGMTAPAGMDFLYPVAIDNPDGTRRNTSAVFGRSSGTFQDSGGALWIYIKSDEESHCQGVYEFISDKLADHVDVDPANPDAWVQPCNSRPTSDAPGGKVVGCRFAENLNNPADPITVANHTLVSYEDVDHAGASFVLSQRFILNWEQLHTMTEEQIEDVIGRTTDDVIIPTRDPRSHIKSARVRNEAGNSQFVMRLGLPFGTSKLRLDRDMARRGSNIRDEEGIYFAGFARSVRMFESIMDNQIGDRPGFMRDRLLSLAKSDLGGFFYIPSRADLGLPDLEPWEGRADRRWTGFPGIDWSRLSRHFTKKSPNGLMYYSHKNYLYEMSTMPSNPTNGVTPPSGRILTLLLDAFSRWQDTWYFEKNQAEMGHLRDYIAADPDFGAEVADDVMQESVMVRKGWATRMTCRLYASEEYGRTPLVVNGERQTGADTFRIHPQDIIVGSMPDLSLGQGRFVMKYFRDDEQQPSFFAGLTEASGVGHIVPDHQKLVDEGLPNLIAKIEKKVAKIEKKPKMDQDAKKLAFYEACKLSLEGVRDHLLRFADLADKMAGEMAKGQTAEKCNLEEIAARLKKIASDKPDTLKEAAQLIFTYHSCLHMNSEPVSIGRLDQYLDRFCEQDIAAGNLTEEEAQEVIDSFFVKLDEKVLLNRIFIQDHQPYGNLAMGGASGPYPQGASLGQWIMQVTVGGAVATQAGELKPSYNRVARLCLRAAARLPLNAPCLSLRVRKDMPRDYLEDAATAILSGGAHPILMNDDKIIPGIKASGDDIGAGGDNSNQFTPVAEKAEGKWSSEVSLASACNYACDGCYEPMFVGQNWFTLGGFSTLEPLECALNQGRLYASAGPAYLDGQNHSFRSKPAHEIETFDELFDLYLEHFYMLTAKALDQQLSTFDALAAYCPAPLLSVLMDDCLDKGMDLYEGGARYNVYGPCFIALSSTINSLYNIKRMVFDKDSAVTSLTELVECLKCDWGHKMVEPFVSRLIGPVRTAGKAQRWMRLREFALQQPRYGRGNKEIDDLGNYLIEQIAARTVKVFRDPFPSTAEKMLNYAKKHGTSKKPFGGFQIQPGIGTFENFIEFGKGSGASADGRRLNAPIASDLSPAPSPSDKPPEGQLAPFSRSLAGFTGAGTDSIWDGAPTDFNIPEDFPQDALVKVLNEFADGQGSNILTITCASPDTFADAPDRPEMYDLLRVRMGGWSEFFTSMFADSQQQHLRRPQSTP